MAETASVIAVSSKEAQMFGCPRCGYGSGTQPISSGGCAMWQCGECSTEYVVLADGVTKSTIGVGGENPELQPHPRRGTPAHGRPDKRPDGDGDFFQPRVIGTDCTPGCFVCGGAEGVYSNISAYVQCKVAGERVVAMFQHGARLDYREREPDYVQVKIGACDTHLDNLQELHNLTMEDGVITDDIVATAAA